MTSLESLERLRRTEFQRVSGVASTVSKTDFSLLMRRASTDFTVNPSRAANAIMTGVAVRRAEVLAVFSLRSMVRKKPR